MSSFIRANQNDPLRVLRQEILYRDRIGVGWFATVWLGEWRNMRIAVKHLTITDAMSYDERTVRANLFRGNFILGFLKTCVKVNYNFQNFKKRRCV